MSAEQLAPYVQEIAVSGTDTPLTARFQPGGVIIINSCDAIVTVSDGRQTWKCPPGRTLSRPIVAGNVSGQYHAKTDVAASQGYAIVILTPYTITSVAGADAEIGALFRRSQIDVSNATASNNVVVVDSTIALSAARYAQVMVRAFVQATDGTVTVQIYDVSAGGSSRAFVEFTIPCTNGDTIPFVWRLGPGGDMPLPASLRVRVVSNAGFSSPSNSVSVTLETWENP
jgi:hypothetical protein